MKKLTRTALLLAFCLAWSLPALAGPPEIPVNSAGRALILDDLAVYKDDYDGKHPLTFGVRAGKFVDGETTVSYLGASGAHGSPGYELAANGANYVYMTTAGLVVVNQTGFPAAGTTAHVPLAVVTTANGSYTAASIEDSRGGSLFRPQSAMTAAQASHWGTIPPSYRRSLKTVYNVPMSAIGTGADTDVWVPLTTAVVDFDTVNVRAGSNADVDETHAPSAVRLSNPVTTYYAEMTHTFAAAKDWSTTKPHFVLPFYMPAASLLAAPTTIKLLVFTTDPTHDSMQAAYSVGSTNAFAGWHEMVLNESNFITQIHTIVDDANATISTASIIRGVTAANSTTGTLYPSVVDDTGGHWHIDLYKEVGRTTLEAHTGDITANGTYALTADGASGLSGTLTVANFVSIAADVDITIHSFNWSSVLGFKITLNTPSANRVVCPVTFGTLRVFAPPAKAVLCLTIDDIMVESYSAAQIMAAYGLRATFFTPTNMVGYTGNPGLGSTGYLTAAQLSEIARMGHEIANHSATHNFYAYYNSTTAHYVAGDGVNYLAVPYICLLANTHDDPKTPGAAGSETYWAVASMTWDNADGPYATAEVRTRARWMIENGYGDGAYTFATPGGRMPRSIWETLLHGECRIVRGTSHPIAQTSETGYAASVGENMVLYTVWWDKSHNGIDTTAEIAAAVDAVIANKGVCCGLFHTFKNATHATYYSLQQLRTICADIAAHVAAGDLIVCPVGEVPDVLRRLDLN